jgi:cytochrome c oxidase subunit 4
VDADIQAHAGSPAIGHAQGHVLSYGFLASVWAGLLVLTGITVYVSSIDLGFLNVAVALSVASVKAMLVIFFFMHLKYENRLLQWFVFLAFLILAICIGFTFFDVAYRG